MSEGVGGGRRRGTVGPEGDGGGRTRVSLVALGVGVSAFRELLLPWKFAEGT